MERYLDILKRAWQITWRYKALWVLGLFAGTASGGGGGGGNTGYDFGGGTGSGSDPFSGISDARIGLWIEQNVLLIAILAGALVVFGILMMVLSVAAQGGLVWGANEAGEGRAPRLGASWSAGFSRWGRTFMTGFVLGLPVVLIALIMIALLVTAGIGGVFGGDSGAAAAGIGMCVVLPVFVFVLIAAGLLLGILYPVALRYGILHDVTFGAAIRRAWEDLWAKRGVWVFWLVMLLPGFAYGLAIFLFMLPFLIPAVFLMVAEQWIMAGALVVLLALVLMLPTAVYSTFVSAAWTIFFRRMTGMEPHFAPAPAVAPYAAAYPASSVAPPEPPAPPSGQSWEVAERPIVDVPPPPAPPSGDA